MSFHNERGNETDRGPWRAGCACAASLVSTWMLLAWSGAALAQEARFGVAPSARTQSAISSPPTTSGREDEGFYAAVGFGFQSRSDVRRESVDELEDPQDDGGAESDTAFVITPQAGYKRFIGRHSAEINVNSRFDRFTDLTNEDTDNYTVRGLSNLDVTRILDVDLFGSFTDAAEPRGGSGTRLNQDVDPDEIEISRYGGALSIGRSASRIQIRLFGDRSEWRYQNNQQQFRDRDDGRVGARVFYNISPRTSVFVGTELRNVDFRQPSIELDSEELSYEGGARWEITERSTGQLSIGRTEKDFDNPELEDDEATTVAGRLSWSPRERTTLSVVGSRQFEETTSLEDTFFISELIGATISQSFGTRWTASAYVNRTDDEFDSGREDEITDYGFGLDYAFRRWLSFGVDYSVVERESNIPGNDFDDEILSLNINGNFGIDTRNR